ncbi:hypothetical protein [Grimontia hollisae]|uniref:hypothetical protein n=1 Tax=Grimontia hollisae TaxID=673 RepID=UPI000E02C8BF|nr:hypothetical protein [Grimontia hollisae]STR61866.1 Uncharacterised protein [Grimontia hollisae]
MESQRKAKAENIEGLLASRTETLQCAFQAGLRETESLGSAKELDAFLNAATCFCSSKQPDEVITAFFISVPKVVKNNCDNVTIEIKESIDTLSKWLGVERLTQFLNVLPQVSARLCSREALIIYLKTGQPTDPNCTTLPEGFLTEISPSFDDASYIGSSTLGDDRRTLTCTPD